MGGTKLITAGFRFHQIISCLDASRLGLAALPLMGGGAAGRAAVAASLLISLLRIFKSLSGTRSSLTRCFILSQYPAAADAENCMSAVGQRYGWFGCLLKKKALLKVLSS